MCLDHPWWLFASVVHLLKQEAVPWPSPFLWEYYDFQKIPVQPLWKTV